ncbi:MAG: putative sugar phosphate isomerase YwlF [Alphaproteobacteria bacterium MarineAlpha9_Bin1]|nr:MAG: putative sugar phosphate isomerase YwlF [Alphaproteobacteria bacterium MarineAlpha9_Bin1]
MLNYTSRKIGLAADHAGYELKEKIKDFLVKQKANVRDLGTDSENSVDYPDYGKLLGEEIESRRLDLGIAICGSGIGMSIAANRINGVRAALCSNVEMVKLARNHNDANILALGARSMSVEEAIDCLKVFLLEEFNGGRHIIRVEKLG